MVNDVLTIKKPLVAPMPPDQSALLESVYARAARGSKVFVAMSGGVDSSVAAALLKEAGYDVTGVFITVWRPDFVECLRTDDRKEALQAARHLGIPFLTFDFEKEYKEEVVDYMIREYRAGRTPNPDVMCNKQIKFGAFMEKALASGADFIATGHYARLRRETRDDPKSPESQRVKLLAGVDRNKDQSYFLWTLTQKELKHALFPIGELVKPDVRELARKFGLPNAERKDSQGVCFVGEFKMRDFLKNFIPPKRGDVVSETGEVIGYHEGAFYYTLGQRHGFTVTKKSPETPPLYVIAKNSNKNTITVAPDKKRATSARKDVVIADVNFVSGERPDTGKSYLVRYRYRQPLVHAAIESGEAETLTVLFNEPQEAVTPGQSLVIYSGDELVAGGTIT